MPHLFAAGLAKDQLCRERPKFTEIKPKYQILDSVSATTFHKRKTQWPAFFLLLFSALVFHAAAATADDWLWPAGELRIRVVAPDRRTDALRVDLPLELRSGLTGVAAFGPDGTSLPAALIRVGGEAQVAEVIIPNKPQRGRAPLRVEIYLSSTDSDLVRISEDDRTPVAAYIEREEMLARPFSYEELRALDGAEKELDFHRSLPDFQALADDDDEEANARRRGHRGRRDHFRVRRIRLSSFLKIDEPTRAVFAADTGSTSYFLWIDGEPAFSWKDHAPDAIEGRLHGRPVELQTGLHRLDFYMIVRDDEEIPQLLWREIPPGEDFPRVAMAHDGGRTGSLPRTGRAPVSRAPGTGTSNTVYAPQSDNGTEASSGNGLFAPIPAEMLVPAAVPQAYQIELRDGPKSPLVTIESAATYLALDAASSFAVWSFDVDMPETPADQRLDQVVAGDQSLDADTRLVTRSVARPPLRFSRKGYDQEFIFTIPPAAVWIPRREITPRLVLTELPITLESGARLSFDAKLVALPRELHQRVAGAVRIAWEHAADSRRESNRGILPVARPEIANTHSIAIEGAPRSVGLTCLIDNIPITYPVTIKYLLPEDSLDDLQPRGRYIYSGNAPAVLLLPSDQPSPSRRERRSGELSPESMFVVDEFWGIGYGPDGGEALDLLMEQVTGIAASHRHTGGTTANATPDLRKFVIADDALQADVDLVVWAIGITDLQEGVPIAEILRRLSYLTEASLARDKLPVVVTVPPLPGCDPEKLRRLAIAVKEYGLGMKIPVADAYSRAAANPEAFRAFFRTADSEIQLRHPNNAGRKWFCRLVEDTLQQYLNDTKATSDGR